MGARLFISYRRADTEVYAGRMVDRLEGKLDENEIFIDVDAIELGRDFQIEVGKAINAAYLVLVLMGPDWLNARDNADRRRIDLEDDPVRIEIEAALAAGKQIIPVLCGSATMPAGDDLPPSIAPLSLYNAVRITAGKFRQEMAELEKAIDLARHRARSGDDAAGDHSPRLAHASGEEMIAGGTRRAAPAERVASNELGAYRFNEVAQYEGRYTMLRPDFMEKGQIHCYAMSIDWDVKLQALVIRHKGIAGSAYRQFGVIAFAQNEQYLSIDAGTMGWRQLAIFERMDFRRTMFGSLFTLGNISRRQYAPTISPVVLLGYDGPEQETRRVVQGEDEHARFEALLNEARTACINVA